MRTQLIGEAGETDSALKNDIQRLRLNIREVYYRKFLWNNTRIGIDGWFIVGSISSAFVSLSLVEVKEICGKLQSADDLLALWNATYDVSKSMRDSYSTLISMQNQQARQNRIIAVTHSLFHARLISPLRPPNDPSPSLIDLFCVFRRFQR